MGVLNAHRRRAVLGFCSPDQGAGVGFVVQHGVDGVLSHFLPSGGGDALGVEGLGHVEDAPALEHHVEDALDHGVGGRFELQLGGS